MATVDQQVGSQAQANATYTFNKAEVERQKKLFEAGITSRQSRTTRRCRTSRAQKPLTTQVLLEPRARRRSWPTTRFARRSRAPWAISLCMLGDYVTPASVPSTVLTTIDDTSGLEAYIYIPTDRSSEVKPGLPVDILDTDGKVVAQSKVTFISPQVDNGMQGILAKAEVPTRREGSQWRSGECTSDVEFFTQADGSGAGSDADRRTVVCLRGPGQGAGVCRAPGSGHVGRYGGQYLSRAGRIEDWRQGDSVWAAVSG